MSVGCRELLERGVREFSGVVVTFHIWGQQTPAEDQMVSVLGFCHYLTAIVAQKQP